MTVDELNQRLETAVSATIRVMVDLYADELPRLEVERKKGKWEYVQYDGNPKIGNWHCSECRLIVNFGYEVAPYYNYCPRCGAKMEVEE